IADGSAIVTLAVDEGPRHAPLQTRLSATADGDGFVLRLSTGGPVRVHCRGADRVTLEPASWHPTFGGSVPNQCIVAAFSGGVTLETAIVWQDHVDGSAV
ncbi:hypothetical protein, partial [Alloalcanivorax venustensis]|uniref:hypothetical protein n=1 Tax=Alloalcanivorax venustensis TaxID=172371 RepID=UPI003C69A1A7